MPSNWPKTSVSSSMSCRSRRLFELIPGAKLENFNDIMAIDCKSSMAAMLNVPPEKLEFMTAEEYERESEDEDDE